MSALVQGADVRRDEQQRQTRDTRLALALVLAIGGLFIALAWLQVPGVNGTWYWHWPWRRLKLLHTALWLALPMVAFAAALHITALGTLRRWAAVSALGLLMLAAFGLQICAALSHPQGLAHLRAIVESPVATSYYTEALKIVDVRAWLAGFHAAQLALHAATHPPGPVLYYYAWLRVVGSSDAAVAGGIALGALATLGIPLLYAFTGLWTVDRRARLLTCAFYALVPAFVVFFPEFDQIYPVFALGVAIAWVRSLQGSFAFAAVAGMTLAAAAFFAYNLLVLGVFMVLTGVYHIWRTRGAASALREVVRSAALALACFVAFYFALWVLTGFDALRSLTHALAIQEATARILDRPWYATVVFDPYDFMLGSGILAAPLLVLFLHRAASFTLSDPEFAIPLIGLLMIAIVDISGLLRAETARVWMFLQPFAVAPAAGELMRFGARGRALIFAMQWLVVLTLCCTMVFIQP